MQEDQAMSIIGMLVKGDSFMEIVWFGYNVLWIIITCTLYQIFRLKFLKFFVAESILNLVAWFWHNRSFFFSFPDGAISGYYEKFVCFAIVDFLIRTVPALPGLAGAILGLRYLQKIKSDREKASNPASEL